MESAAILRSVHGAQPSLFFLEKPVAAPVSPAHLRIASFSQGSVTGRRLVSSSTGHRGFSVPFTKASETTSAVTSDAITAEMTSKGPVENKHVQKSTFPTGFEALILDVCDQTDIAEVKLKVGDFEMHLKRDIGTAKAPISGAPAIESPTIAPPIPSEPMIESASVAQAVLQQKSSIEPSSPFANAWPSKASKLAALEASGSKSYVLVPSPTVGTFRIGRTVKGKKQPPSCKEGDMIKAGQTIGYIDQFGSELPVRSQLAGEVLKFLFREGEAVGYGDPLVAILPSFSGIE
ncbi:uncharacterized protein M6B38_165315 [Iris pallida]|uniref:Lipoyl-binding domain-containing protein n=1 Tax=Iris pallida TaxID=29817 RepID=A0AAX6EXT7_IRIPA|nr:uncharacterized protein M6B38_165315 [Iris pallida]